MTFDFDHARGLQPDFEVGQPPRAAQQHARANQQQRAQGDLPGHQHVAQTRRPEVAREIASRRLHHVRARRLDGRSEAEQHRRNHRRRQHESEDARVRRKRDHGNEFGEFSRHGREHQALAILDGHLRERETGRRRGERQQHALREQVPDQPRAHRAQRQPDANLPLAGHRAGQHHAGHVGAGDEQYEAKRRHDRREH